MFVDNVFLRVAKVRTLSGRTQLTNATGFFYLDDQCLYLITSRHVVINEFANHHPDSLQLSLHLDARDLRQRADLSIPLYHAGTPQWREHPRFGGTADLVAVAINDPYVCSGHCIDAFRQDDILEPEQYLPVGQDVLIVGFPLGFHDTLHNLPVVRSAIIASSFAHPFKGHPYFLTDARMHRGTSGSPVIARLPSNPENVGACEPSWRLLGVHSAALDVSDRDPHQDERLALNTTWYASLIPQIVIQ